jgi:hypothetical protein
MHGICDSCEESADSLFDLTRLSDFRDVVQRLNYRKVCETCYDDLYEEIKQLQAQSSNRRGDERFQLRLRIHIEGIDREGHNFTEETFTQDVSLAGLRITTRQDIEVGSVLKFNLPDQGFEAAVIVALVWQNDDDLTAGLKLSEPSESWTKLITEQAVSLTK